MYVYNDVYVYIVYVYMCMCPHMYTLICFSEKYAYPLRLEKNYPFSSTYKSTTYLFMVLYVFEWTAFDFKTWVEEYS